MELIRPAGFNERRCIARDSLSLYGTIVTLATYRYTGPDAKPISKEELYKVLKECVIRHPVLGAVVQSSATEKPWLARPPTLDLQKHVRFLVELVDSQDFLKTMLETVHNIALIDYEQQPQWKVYVAYDGNNKFHLAFATSHALADGRSGFFFHRTFLQALRDIKVSQFDESPFLSLPRDGEILPPLELAGNLAISWSYLFRPLLNEYMPNWLVHIIGMQPKTADSDNTGPIWTGASKRPEKLTTELPKTSVQIVELAGGVIQKTLTVCKSHNARLTGLLLHLAVRSLARALELQGETHRKFEVGVAIDLRRCIPQSEGKMGVLVSSANETMTADHTKVVARVNLTDEDWNAVRFTTQRLEIASSSLADQPVGLLKYLSNYRDWTSRRAQSLAESSFEVSNVGLFKDKKTEPSSWAVEQMCFSQSADATGSPFNLNVASVDDGPLLMVLSWWPGMLGVRDERLLAKNVCDGIVAQLEVISN